MQYESKSIQKTFWSIFVLPLTNNIVKSDQVHNTFVCLPYLYLLSLECSICTTSVLLLCESIHLGCILSQLVSIACTRKPERTKALFSNKRHRGERRGLKTQLHRSITSYYLEFYTTGLRVMRRILNRL